MRIWIILSVLLGITSATNSAASAPVPYKDPTQSVEERVEDLLSRMTLKEKNGQLMMTNLRFLKTDAKGDVTPDSLEKLFKGHSIGVLEGPFVEHETIANLSAAADHYLRTKTRLGIPALQMAECLHGQMALNTTIFPQAIGLGCTWNPALIKKMASTVAVEASLSGVDQAFSPLFDLARDPRYGRVEECYGEDPFLVKEMGVAFVKGMQGDPEVTKTGLPENKLACTAKHFAAYSIPDAGINLGPANLGRRSLRELHLYPFEAAVKEANIYVVMPGYHEIDGVPVHADHWLLTELLRGEWGFNGYVCSDAVAIEMLNFFHKTAVDFKDAAHQAISAGVDLEVPLPKTYLELAKLVEEGQLDESVIDQSVRNVLRIKFKTGLFERSFSNPYDTPEVISNKLHTAENILLARTIAEESIVLLKNKTNILPLDANKLKSIAVIGPNADNVQFGDYAVTKNNNYGITVLEGLKAQLGTHVELNYAEGCKILDPSRAGFEAARQAVEESDLTVLVLGGTSVIYSGIGWGDQNSTQPNTCGEGYDRNELNFPGVQPELLDMITECGKPVILVMVNGRPYTIADAVPKMDAILEAWYPGEQGGHAIADILFGKVNPSGHLSVSFPRSTGHIPSCSIYKPSARGFYKRPGSPESPGRDYVFAPPSPLFCFGHGLSYTTFAYADLKIENHLVDNATITVQFKLTNTGKVDGSDVAQLYLRDRISSVTTPVKALKAFKKVHLKAGETKTVSLQIAKEDLKLWNIDMKKVLEPGDFDIYIGSSQEDIHLSGSFKVKEL